MTHYLRAATRAATRLTERLELEHVVQTAVGTLVEDFDAALARLWLHDPVAGRLVLRGSAGLSSEVTDSSLEVARTRQPLLRNQLAGDLAAAVDFPLLSGGELLGVVSCFFRQPLEDEVFEVLGTLAVLISSVLTDVKLVQAERASRDRLEQQQQWLEGVLDLLPLPVVLSEPRTGKLLLTNKLAEELLAGQEGKDFYFTDRDGQLIPDEQTPRQRAARGEELRSVELIWHTPDGARPLLFNSGLVPAGLGHPDTLMLVAQDVSRLKQVEAELQQAVRARDEFLSIASHELKTPLTSLMLQVQGVRRGLEKRPDELSVERLLPRVLVIERQAERLARLVNDLLDVSRASAGQLRLEEEQVDLSLLLEEIVERLGADFEKAGSRVSLSAAPLLVGAWDRLRLEQALTNLLSNAMKYGAGKPIEIAAVRAGDQVEVRVRDRGIGIEHAQQSRIFDRFARAVSERNYGGFGLGLWIARRFVEAMRGTITVESVQGEGATFTVRLPLT